MCRWWFREQASEAHLTHCSLNVFRSSLVVAPSFQVSALHFLLNSPTVASPENPFENARRLRVSENKYPALEMFCVCWYTSLTVKGNDADLFVCREFYEKQENAYVSRRHIQQSVCSEWLQTGPRRQASSGGQIDPTLHLCAIQRHTSCTNLPLFLWKSRVTHLKWRRAGNQGLSKKNGPSLYVTYQSAHYTGLSAQYTSLSLST